MGTPPLNPDEQKLWRSLARLLVVLPRALEEDLQAGTGLSLTHYMVLMSLSEAPHRQLRMSDLASRAALSPSRMSRIVHSLRSDGLVTRSTSAEDGRAGIASLTDAGLARLEAAWPVHLASVRAIVFDRLESDELPSLSSALERVLDAAERPELGCGPPADQADAG